jgi:hypothetical protein
MNNPTSEGANELNRQFPKEVQMAHKCMKSAQHPWKEMQNQTDFGISPHFSQKGYHQCKGFFFTL